MGCEELHTELARKVQEGSTTWEEILDEIRTLKQISLKERFEDILSTYNQVVDITIDDTEHVSRKILEIPTTTHNPYLLTLRKELFEKLPDKARLLVDIILNSDPFDFRENSIGYRIFRYNTQNKKHYVKLGRIKDLLKDLGWTKREITIAFSSLTKYANTLNTV